MDKMTPLHESQLAIGLVCCWQNGGWHGCDVITKFNKRFIYSKTCDDGKIATFCKEERRHSRSEFMNTHSVFFCGHDDKYLGKVVEVKDNKIVKVMERT
jgi:hypothetical protein